MKILSAKVHGLIDYLVAIFLWLSPTLFGLSAFISAVAYSLGAIHLLLTIFTRYQYGVFNVIPLRLHSGIEFIVGVVLILSPTVVSGFPDVNTSLDRLFLGGVGFAVLTTWALTDYAE